jgi:hypothetical protein
MGLFHGGEGRSELFGADRRSLVTENAHGVIFLLVELLLASTKCRTIRHLYRLAGSSMAKNRIKETIKFPYLNISD